MDELDLRAAEREEMPAGEITSGFVARLRTGVGSAVLDDEAILLDPATGASHLLDAPATLVVRCLDGVATLDEIAFDIADVLGLDRAAVDSDVLGLMRTLGENGLLEGVARDPHAGHQHPRPTQGVPVGADLGGWEGWVDLRPGDRPVVLVNWGTSCGFCTRIGGELAELAPRLDAAGIDLMLLTTGGETALREQLGDLELPVLFVESVPEFFADLGTPVAYLVGSDRTVLEPIALGADAVPTLCRTALD